MPQRLNLHAQVLPIDKPDLDHKIFFIQVIGMTIITVVNGFNVVSEPKVARSASNVHIEKHQRNKYQLATIDPKDPTICCMDGFMNEKDRGVLSTFRSSSWVVLA
jgi:hypothetical protein